MTFELKEHPEKPSQQIIADLVFELSDREYDLSRPPSYRTELIEEVEGADYKWVLWRNRCIEQRFQSLEAAHAYITKHHIKVDYIIRD